MRTNPLNEILETERAVTAAINAANDDAAAAVTEARRHGEHLVAEARARGTAVAERRYAEGLARARDESERIRSTSDELVARLRHQAEAHIPSAVDLVTDTVLPGEP